MKIALGNLPFPGSVERAVGAVAAALEEAAKAGAQILCLPENFAPGLRGVGFEAEPHDPAALLKAFDDLRAIVPRHGVALLLGAEHPSTRAPLISAIV